MNGRRGQQEKPFGWETKHKNNKDEGARYRLHIDDHLNYDFWLHANRFKTRLDLQNLQK